jgi:hypothetical protein
MNALSALRRPLDTATPLPQTRGALAKLLVEFGVSVLKTVCQPEVLTVFRLAIAESDRAPEIARTLDHSGREVNHKTLAELLTKAQKRRLVAAGDPAASAARYFAVLWGDLLLSLLMRVRGAPTEREIQTRARAATEILFCRFPYHDEVQKLADWDRCGSPSRWLHSWHHSPAS